MTGTIRIFFCTLITVFCGQNLRSARAQPAPFNPSAEKVDIMRIAVGRINQAIEKKLVENNLTYNSSLNDFLFARRVYVDLTGTIPTYEELVTFANNENKNKRTFLVNQLLASEGYVSHNYNYFADLLRIQTKMQDRKYNTAAVKHGVLGDKHCLSRFLLPYSTDKCAGTAYLNAGKHADREQKER